MHKTPSKYCWKNTRPWKKLCFLYLFKFFLGSVYVSDEDRQTDRRILEPTPMELANILSRPTSFQAAAHKDGAHY